jgi:Flp pilus assembly protein protease CpaA
MLAPAAVAALGLSLLAPPPTPWLALAGGAVGFAIFVIIGLVGRGAMGAGDVKLMGVVGLIVGYPAIFAAMIYGVLLGGAAALYLLLVKRAGRKTSFAYAPWLTLGALITLFILYRS